MERDYPTNTDSFCDSSEIDRKRIHRLQTNDQCDGVVISRYSLSFISTQIDSCDGLYPLYDEELFAQDVIVPISQTLEGLGDELINIMDIMANKNLYRDNHDDYVAKLGEECKFRALNDQKSFGWKLFLFPIVFSVSLAVIAFTVGFVKYMRLRKSGRDESCKSEPQEDLASLLDHNAELNNFSSEVKRLNEESENRILKRIIESMNNNFVEQNTESIQNNSMKTITGGIENGIMKRTTEDIKNSRRAITESTEYTDHST